MENLSSKIIIVLHLNTLYFSTMYSMLKLNYYSICAHVRILYCHDSIVLSSCTVA